MLHCRVESSYLAHHILFKIIKLVFFKLQIKDIVKYKHANYKENFEFHTRFIHIIKLQIVCMS